MKKIIMFLLAVFCSLSLFAVMQTSEYSLISYPITRVYRNEAGVVVVFMKNSTKPQQLYIPARWFNFFEKKAALNRMPNKFTPYVTVYYKNNEFHKVVVNMPENPVNPAWQRIPNGMDFSTQFASENFVME